MTSHVIRVAPHEVEHGDLLFGRTWRPVDSILLDCSDGQEWIFGDEHGRTIARCKVWGSVQVIRDLPGEALTQSLASACLAAPVPEVGTRPADLRADWCNPRGIARRHGHLEIVE
jgi:hypothetical protein